MKTLMDTKWLAQRLGISESKVQKARCYAPETLPPAVTIGRTVRYDPETVEQWILDQMKRDQEVRMSG